MAPNGEASTQRMQVARDEGSEAAKELCRGARQVVGFRQGGRGYGGRHYDAAQGDRDLQSAAKGR